MKDFLQKYARFFRNIYTSGYATILSLIFARLYYDSTVEFRNESDIIFHAAHQLFFFNLLTLAIVLLAVIVVYYYFDNLDLFNKKDYLNGKSKKLLISRPEYLIGFAISLLAATAMLTNPLHTLLSTFGEVNKAWARFAAILVLALIRLIQLYNLQVKWEDEIEHPLFTEQSLFKSSNDIESFKIRHLILKPIGFVIILALCFSLASQYYIGIIYSVYNIFTSLWQGILVIILVPVVLFFLFRVLHNLRLRRKLIKKLKALERIKYATIIYKGTKYLSAIFPLLPFSIEVTDRLGKVYLCNIVCSGNVNAPMYFTEDKYYTEHGFHLRNGLISSTPGSRFAMVVDIGKISGKQNPTNLVAGYRREHDILFPEKEGARALIVNPVSTTCFSIRGTIANAIDTGENMGNYTIYTATGFYNMIERDVNKDRFE